MSTLERLAPPRRTQAERTTTTRRRLLAAACASLLDSGAQAITLADVARRAGVTTGAVQAHFGTKSGLFLAVFDQISEDQLQHFDNLEIPSSANRQDRFRAVVADVWDVAQLQGARVLAALSREAHADLELRRAITEHHRVLRDRWASTVARQVDPELASHPQFPAALHVLLVFIGGLVAPPGPLMTEAQAQDLLRQAADLLEAALAHN